MKPHVNVGRIGSRSMVPMLMAVACGMGRLPGFFGEPSGAYIRNDPEREKTQADIDAIEAAKAKRARKAARQSTSKPDGATAPEAQTEEKK